MLFFGKLIMKFIVLFSLFLMFVSAFCSAIPKSDSHQSKKVYEKKLSEKEHGEGDEHNMDYDHDAFVGKDDARTFDELSPEESKKRLGNIFDKIDVNRDNLVTENELVNWIKLVQHKYAIIETDRQWREYLTQLENGKLHWTTYKKTSYGEDSENHMNNDIDDDDDDDNDSTKKMIIRDEKRWKKADSDNDGYLTKDEFMYFLHPEEADHMKDVVVDETLEDIDKDHDGKISLEEYINDLWPESEREDSKNEPDWLSDEREQFSNSRDKNKDGFMDRDEVIDWIIPEDYDHSASEAKHLFEEADADEDGNLTKEEVLNKHEVFVGSQATDFGEVLTNHDEF